MCVLMSLVINTVKMAAPARFSRYVHRQHAVPPTAAEAAVNDSKLAELTSAQNSCPSYTANFCFRTYCRHVEISPERPR